MVNGSFESGDFDENGEYDENSPQSSRYKSDKKVKLPLGKWWFWQKKAEMAKIGKALAINQMRW